MLPGRLQGESKLRSLSGFCIVAWPRTGSTMLTELLHSHPEIICHREPFNANAIYSRHPILKHPHMKKFRTEDPLRLLELMLWNYTDENKIIGFKLLHNQNSQVEHFVLRNSGIKKILVRRDKALAVFSSHQIAFGTSQWHLS